MGYFGSKDAAGITEAIIAQMRPHETYIETHLGGGAVLKRKPRAARTIGLDLDHVALRPFRKMPWSGSSLELNCQDCVDHLKTFDFKSAGRVLVYADPPYVLATRTSNKRYRFDYTDKDHRRLIATLRRIPADVILSGYPSALYDELVGDWRTLELQTMTRGGVRTEKLWMNFVPDAAFWSTCAGKDATDRQRIKRKAANWRRDWLKCPPGERTAILAAMLAPAPLDAGIYGRRTSKR